MASCVKSLLVPMETIRMMEATIALATPSLLGASLLIITSGWSTIMVVCIPIVLVLVVQPIIPVSNAHTLGKIAHGHNIEVQEKNLLPGPLLQK